MAIRIANAVFHYGFEYLGVGDKLVQTPLTDKAYLTLTQALHMRMGGNPFGPAGTGKTETVKALGAQLGNFVLVFNCDESFDFQAMGRIFVGLCQVGAWGCFDEFNRLEERMLSAVSELILTIQVGMKAMKKTIELLGKPVKLNRQMGIFVTMNPGYAGRSNLPDNLKQLFRGLAMTKPDKKLIAQVMLFSQGFQSASRLAGKIVSLFELCGAQLSAQPHYDFGLRSLKAVLLTSGNLKRDRKMRKNNRVGHVRLSGKYFAFFVGFFVLKGSAILRLFFPFFASVIVSKNLKGAMIWKLRKKPFSFAPSVIKIWDTFLDTGLVGVEVGVLPTARTWNF